MKLIKIFKKNGYKLEHTQYKFMGFYNDCISVYDNDGFCAIIQPKTKPTNYNGFINDNVFLNSYNDKDYEEMLNKGVEIINNNKKNVTKIEKNINSIR